MTGDQQYIDNIDFDKWTKREFIETMPLWPCLTTKTTPEGQKDFLKTLQNHYLGLSTWLTAYELGKGRLLSELPFSPLSQWKPFADLSVARLNFAKQIHPKLELAQKFDNFEVLWGLWEYNIFEHYLRAGGLKGNPTTNEAGRVMSKSDWMVQENQIIKAKHRRLETGEPYDGKTIADFNWREHFYDLLLQQAVDLATEEDDEDLGHHCKQYLDARANFSRIVFKGEHCKNYQILYLLSDNSKLRTTGKSKKSSKHRGFAPTRPRGRPIGSRNQKGCKEI